jgi:hypothetical protein
MSAWYPPVSTFDCGMPMEEILSLAACFQAEELCSL